MSAIADNAKSAHNRAYNCTAVRISSKSKNGIRGIRTGDLNNPDSDTDADVPESPSATACRHQWLYTRRTYLGTTPRPSDFPLRPKMDMGDSNTRPRHANPRLRPRRRRPRIALRAFGDCPVTYYASGTADAAGPADANGSTTAASSVTVADTAASANPAGKANPRIDGRHQLRRCRRPRLCGCPGPRRHKTRLGVHIGLRIDAAAPTPI